MKIHEVLFVVPYILISTILGHVILSFKKEDPSKKINNSRDPVEFQPMG